MARYVCFCLLGLFLGAGLALSVQAQSISGKAKDAQFVAMADEVYRNSGAKLQALEQYRLALNANPDNLKANYMAGICYLQTIQKERSLAHFLRVYDLAPTYETGMNIGQDLYPDLLFLIGQAYHYGENFDRATEYYKRFATSIREGKGSQKAKENKTQALKTVERRLFECETGRQLKSYPIEVNINPLPAINSAYPDYAPAVDAKENTMIFTSRRPGGRTPEVDNDLFYFEDIYVTQRTGDTTWGEPTLLGGVNTERHEASVTLSADGNTIILYKDDNGGDLYVSRKRDGKWTKPRSIGSNVNTSFRESSAFISPDGKHLYFASDRPGGFGGTDLYVSSALDGDKWGVPSNLGATLNTEYDDESPVFSFDQRFLYFSSKGHRGMGGYDIFRSYYDTTRKEWARPENMGYPINTADNDLYYVQGSDLGHAYFASARESGTGDLDVYLIRPVNPADSLLIRGPKIDPAKRKAAPALADDKTNMLSDSSQSGGLDKYGKNAFADSSQKYLAKEFAGLDSASTDPNTHVRIKLNVIEKGTGRLLDAKIAFTDVETGQVHDPHRETRGVYLQTLPTDKARSFMISAEKQGYQFRNMTVKVRRGEDGHRILERVLELEPIALNKPRILRNLYFDFDQVALRKESFRELNLLATLMKENPKLIIEVAGHTDYIGTEAYNQKLSERRAKSVVAYLRSQGIDASRLRAKGYGKRIPIASNDDEKDGRELNRRTEFEVISGRTRE